MPNAPEVVGLGTARYGGKTRVCVKIASSRPKQPPAWIQMGQFILYIPSGELIIWGPETRDLHEAPTISLERGRYHGIAFSRGTDEVLDEMAMVGPDEYLVVLWI